MTEKRIFVLLVATAVFALAPVLSPAAWAQQRACQAAGPFDVAAGCDQAVYGDAMPDLVKNYLRAAPHVGTGGVVCCEDGYATLAELGFRTVVNLNTRAEGSERERQLAEAAGLSHFGIEVATKAPTVAQVQAFAAIVDDPAHYPILVHCQSANRVGAMWALYRATNGVPPEVAIQEGRTVGLKPSREAAVRALLHLPAD